METLPAEIADEILEQVLWENPQDLYRLRRVSKTWKSMIDRSNHRLLTVWCNKCTDEISKTHLDDMFQTKYPQFASWQKYCTDVFPKPHIARDIYDSRNEFPNLIYKKMSLTRICPPPKRQDMENIYISGYAFNDKYFALSWVTIEAEPNDMSAVRVYSINDLHNHIREYKIPCGKIHLYCTDTQMFLLLLEYERGQHGLKDRISMVEFLVSDNVVPANLPLSIGSDPLCYVITNNQCFTYVNTSNWIRHHRMTPSGFKWDTMIRLPQVHKPTEIVDVHMCDSKLFVTVSVGYTLINGIQVKKLEIYEYQITRRSSKLLFAGPQTYERKTYGSRIWTDYTLAFPLRRIHYAPSNNIPLQNRICNLYPQKLHKWLKKFFKTTAEVHSVTVFPHHVIAICGDPSNTCIVFRGDLSQLMDYAVNDLKPGTKCTVMNLKASRLDGSDDEYGISVIHQEDENYLINRISLAEFLVTPRFLQQLSDLIRDNNN